MKKIILRVTAVILCMVILLAAPSAALDGAAYGLALWYKTLFPTLLPFMVLSNFIVYTGCARPIGMLFLPLTRRFRLPDSSGYCILTGYLCGYPMGAYVCGVLNETKELDDASASFLAPLCNNVSPMFMISYISMSCLKDEKFSVIVVPILMCSAFISLLITCAFRAARHNKSDRRNAQLNMAYSNTDISISTSDAISRSVDGALSASLKLCIYVMLFSIAGTIIGSISFLPDMAKAALMSLMEITAGLDKISDLNIELKYKILMMLSFTAFGGMSSVLQTMALWRGNNFKISSYILYKLGITAATAASVLFLIVIGVL